MRKFKGWCTVENLVIHRGCTTYSMGGISSFLTILRICLSCGGNQQQDSRVEFQVLQKPMYPTFLNEAWPAITILCRPPGCIMSFEFNQSTRKCANSNSTSIILNSPHRSTTIYKSQGTVYEEHLQKYYLLTFAHLGCHTSAFTRKKTNRIFPQYNNWWTKKPILKFPYLGKIYFASLNYHLFCNVVSNMSIT